MKNAEKKIPSSATKGEPLGKDAPFPFEASGGTPPSPDICLARYSVTLAQIPDGGSRVFILAEGVHPTSGYEVFFHKSPLSVYPPEFSLWHVKTAGPILEVITPFAKFTGFAAEGAVDIVKITDAAGRHEIAVKPIGDLALKHI